MLVGSEEWAAADICSEALDYNPQNPMTESFWHSWNCKMLVEDWATDSENSWSVNVADWIKPHFDLSAKNPHEKDGINLVLLKRRVKNSTKSPLIEGILLPLLQEVGRLSLGLCLGFQAEPCKKHRYEFSKLTG